MAITKRKLVNRIKKEFPDFIEDHCADWYSFLYCGNWQVVALYEKTLGDAPEIQINQKDREVIEIGLDIPFLNYVDKDLLNSNTPSDFEKLLEEEKDEGEPLVFEIKNLLDNDVSIIISGLRGWKKKCDSLRHGQDKDVIFIIHPDIDEYYLPDLLRDVRCIVGYEDDWRVGIINTKNWNFENRDFLCFLYTNSGDSLDICKENIDEVPYKILKMIEKLRATYPEAKDITEIYNSDWD